MKHLFVKEKCDSEGKGEGDDGVVRGSHLVASFEHGDHPPLPARLGDGDELRCHPREVVLVL